MISKGFKAGSSKLAGSTSSGPSIRFTDDDQGVIGLLGDIEMRNANLVKAGYEK